jgi:hypothetical protein
MTERQEQTLELLRAAAEEATARPLRINNDGCN